MSARSARPPLLLVPLVLLALIVLPAGPAAGATAYLPPDGAGAGTSPGAPARGSGAAQRMARTHILVELGQGVDETRFLERARGQGLRRLGRVYGTRWLTMAIPAGAAPRAAAAAARGLAGVVRSSPDLLIQAYHHTGPVSPPYVRDPLYIYDDAPTTKPDCEPCTAAQIVDQWGLFRVDAESGWDIETGGMTSDDDEVVIAIIDSGMDLDHDDLRDNLWFNPKELPDGLDNDGNGFVDDLHGADFVGEGVGSPLDDPASQDANPDIPDHGTWIEDWDAPWLWRFDGDPATGDAMDNNGDFIVDLGVFHGTFVAGIAAAATDNVNPETLLYEGIAGACWNCKLMPVRMIDAEGSGLMSNAAAAIRYAADNGADIINASWGVGTNGLDPADVEIVRQAVDYAVGRGVIVVAATGNAGTPGLSFPAAMANTIAVGSSDWTDAWSAFSSYGYSAETPDDGIDNDGNGWVDDTVDVVAPGEAMWSTTVISPYDAFILNGWDWYCCAENPGPDDWYPGEDAYTRSDGTSFATPLVAGHIGVLLSANCGADLDDVRQAIRASALDVGLPGYDARTGFGRLQFVVPTNIGSGSCGGSGDNVAPSANAGADQQIVDQAKPGEEVTLDGSGSSDSDGVITAYEWRANGALIATGATPTLTLGTGVHDIVLTVTDNGGADSSDSVRVELCKKSCGGDATPAAPVAEDDTYSVPAAGGSHAEGPPGVLQNDSDPNGDPLTARLVSPPASANAFGLNADGSFSYTHDGSAVTSDSFSYRAVDNGGLESNVATVTISVGGPTGSANAIYMADVSFQMKGRSLNVTVTVRRDSNADGSADGGDVGVGQAVVHGTLCSLDVPGVCHFGGTPIGTGGNGQATYKLFGAAGRYEYRWTRIEHETYTWDPNLDATNPSEGP
jgi:subtilisin family serine protease